MAKTTSKSAPTVVSDEAGFNPYISPSENPAELSAGPLIVGAVLGIIFGASSLYLVLRIGMTVSASIPIAVLSITLFRAFSRAFGTRKATILENNMVQTVGSAGESIAFGVGVTIPALMILGYEMEVLRVMLLAVLGGLLGILMMIPLRKAFIVRQHGKLPYPEGTACAEVLIVGERGGSSAKTVFAGFGLAFAYKLLMQGMKLWNGEPETAVLPKSYPGAHIGMDVSPELVGVGYIIGPRIACTMAAGGILASLVLIPAIKLFGDGLTAPIFPATKLIRDMEPHDVWQSYILYIGAGAVAAGGIISLFQALPLIAASLKAGLSDLAASRKAAGGTKVPRTDRDLSLKTVLFGCIGLILAIALAPQLDMSIGGAIMIVLFGFLFVTVSSRITGEIGSSSNPISGMTVATLLLTCLIFVLFGKDGPIYRSTALSVAAIVCIAASNGGTTSQDLKTGHLVGATPRSQQIGILIGALTSALVIGWTLLVLNDAGTVYSKKPENLPHPTHAPTVQELTETVTPPGASEALKVWRVSAGDAASYGVPQGKYLVDDAGTVRYLVDPGINGVLKTTDGGTLVPKYEAPKARLMSMIIDGIMTRQLPWGLVLIGVFIAVVLELSGVPALPFAVGVYLPVSASMPIFLGGVIRWGVDKYLKRRGQAESESSPGVLLSSGYIAGGAIAGILIALVALLPGVAESLDLSSRLGTVNAMIPLAALVAVLVMVGVGKWLRDKSA